MIGLNKIDHANRERCNNFVEKNCGGMIYPNLSGVGSLEIAEFVKKQIQDGFEDELCQWYELLLGSKTVGIARMRYLQWDTDVLKVRSGMIDFIIVNDGLEFSEVVNGIKSLTSKLINEEVVFVALKVDACMYKIIHAAEEIGYKVVDTQIILEKEVGRSDIKPLSEGFSLHEFSNEEVPGVEVLGGVFEYTRFHSDQNIGNDKADKVWSEIIKSSCTGFSDRVFLASDCNGKPVAIVTVHFQQIGEKLIANLFSVGVLADYRGSGIGSSLISYAEDYCSGRTDRIIVETQACNYSSVSFYIKNGFKQCAGAQTALHYWNN